MELSLPSGWDWEDMMIGFSSSARVLALAGVQRKLDTPAGPSWMPDLSVLMEECLRKSGSYAEPPFNWAGGKIRMDFAMDNIWQLLQVRGVLVDLIRSVTVGTQYYSKDSRRRRTGIGEEQRLPLIFTMH